MEAAGEARSAGPASEELRAEAPGGRHCSSAEEAALEVRWGPARTARALRASIRTTRSRAPRPRRGVLCPRVPALLTPGQLYAAIRE